jgi:hypothetical protein
VGISHGFFVVCPASFFLLRSKRLTQAGLVAACGLLERDGACEQMNIAYQGSVV